MAKNPLALTDRMVELLSAAEARNGLPAGTMFSVMQQEIGGQQRFLDDPSLPHYPTGVAPNGKKSSAFGPFGILESTARDPGYGVTPLKNKSIEEQIRLSSDYLAARTRAAGGDLNKGMAAYGEGAKYANQVASRIGGGRGVVNPAPVVVQAEAVNTPAPQVQAVPIQVATQDIPAPVVPVPADPANDPWTKYQQEVSIAMADRFKPGDMQYGKAPVTAPVPAMPVGPADYQELLAADIASRPSFSAFQGLSRLGRRAA